MINVMNVVTVPGEAAEGFAQAFANRESQARRVGGIRRIRAAEAGS